MVPFPWVWSQKGQFDLGELLIDQGTLACRVLLCPQWACEQLYHPSLKPRDHSCRDEWGRGRGVYRNRGDKAPCHSGMQLDRGRGMGVSWAGLGGGGGLINGSCFGPNTQLADLTKCSFSSPPLFFLARCNVCPQRTGGGEGESGAGVIKVREVVPEHILYHQLLSSIKCNEMRLGGAEFIFFHF